MRTKKVKVFRRVRKLLCKSGFWCMINRKAHTEAKAHKTGGADVPLGKNGSMEGAVRCIL